MEVASIIFCEKWINTKVLEFFSKKGRIQRDESDYYIIDNNGRLMYILHFDVDYDYEKELNNSKEASDMALNMFPEGMIRQIDISFKNHDQFYIDLEILLDGLEKAKVIVDCPFDGLIRRERDSNPRYLIELN